MVDAVPRPNSRRALHDELADEGECSHVGGEVGACGESLQRHDALPGAAANCWRPISCAVPLTSFGVVQLMLTTSEPAPWRTRWEGAVSERGTPLVMLMEYVLMQA